MPSTKKNPLNKYTVLYLHGNAGNIAIYHRVTTYKILNELGLNVLAFDYTGFGLNAGTPSEENLAHDAFDMLQTALSKIKATESLIIWAHSLGSGAFFQMLRRYKEKEPISRIKSVILEAPFLSITRVVYENYFPNFLQQLLPISFLEYFLKEEIDSLEVVRSIETLNFPVFIVHENEDCVIPFHHGEELHNLLQKRTHSHLKKLVGSSHSEIALRSDFKEII